MAKNRKQEKSVQLLQAVDEACRKSGGRHLLTREEYLEIVNDCYLRIYGTKPDEAEQSSSAMIS